MLEGIWETFMDALAHSQAVSDCEVKKVAGIPFLFVRPASQAGARGVLENVMTAAAARSMKGKQLNAESHFVRMTPSGYYVYRFRFLVPQRKMFCCGNGCTDCIRFKSI
ncbi:hypothetical protein [Bacillus marinisedimentorum]|uniref:hypothetical protein n=1 Tax=Bacillus marinisedimentorum TaxID=1821260 RepID=UPI0009F59209|nr:hypothetical protein [Bacillus marinisedimentorum]